MLFIMLRYNDSKWDRSTPIYLQKNQITLCDWFGFHGLQDYSVITVIIFWSRGTSSKRHDLGQVVPRRGCAAGPSISQRPWPWHVVHVVHVVSRRPGDVDQYSWTSTRGPQNGTQTAWLGLPHCHKSAIQTLLWTETSFLALNLFRDVEPKIVALFLGNLSINTSQRIKKCEALIILTIDHEYSWIIRLILDSTWSTWLLLTCITRKKRRQIRMHNLQHFGLDSTTSTVRICRLATMVALLNRLCSCHTASKNADTC